MSTENLVEATHEVYKEQLERLQEACMNCPNCNHKIDLHEHDAKLKAQWENKHSIKTYVPGFTNLHEHDAEVHKPLVDALELISEQVPHFQNVLLKIDGRDIWLHDFIADALAKVKQ